MSSNSRPFGIHFRLHDSFSALAQEAADLNLTAFQFFLIPQQAKDHLSLKADDKKRFLQLRSRFKELVVHCSYWINLVSGNRTTRSLGYSILKKEIALAEKLEVTTMVIHAGSASHHKESEEDPHGITRGIEHLAKFLNKVAKKNPAMTFLVENTAHANHSVGSNLEDFIRLRKLIEFPDQIGFCLDIAHAFSYGYNLNETQAFIDLIKNTMTIDSLKLLHVHDSAEAFASKKDRHALPGNGEIGIEPLKKLIMHPDFANIPIIMELPPTSHASIKSAIKNLELAA